MFTTISTAEPHPTDVADPGLDHVQRLIDYGCRIAVGSKISESASDGSVMWLTIQTPDGEMQVRISRPAAGRESDAEMADRMRRESQANPFSPEYRRPGLTLDTDDMLASAMADAFEPRGLGDCGDDPIERRIDTAVALGSGFSTIDPND